MHPSGVRNIALAALLGVAACESVDGVLGLGRTRCRAPDLFATAVAANQNNVLSAVVTTGIRWADSVAVRFGPSREALDSITPAVLLPASDDSLGLSVLGLHPASSYVLQVVAFNRCAIVSGSVLAFTTGALPVDLPHYTAGGQDPSPGYVVFAAGNYGLAIDNSGRVVWYHRFPNGPGLNFQAQPTGRYVARPTPSSGIANFVEITPLGVVARTLGCARGLQPRLHDLIAEQNGAYWVMCDETRTMDLSSVGGAPDALVTGTAIQHISASGNLLFEWSPFEHLRFEITDVDPVERSKPAINWTHGNALDIDNDNNLLVSFRNLSEITKIDARNGTVIWRMGGLHNEFHFIDTPTPPFARQHGLRASGNGRILLLDNLGDPSGSRAERYELDEVQRVARLTGTLDPGAGVVAQLGGTTQLLPAGRTLVSFGTGGRVEEYDADGNVVWRIDGNTGYVFRAQRIRSLYEPGSGSLR